MIHPIIPTLPCMTAIVCQKRKKDAVQNSHGKRLPWPVFLGLVTVLCLNAILMETSMCVCTYISVYGSKKKGTNPNVEGERRKKEGRKRGVVDTQW